MQNAKLSDFLKPLHKSPLAILRNTKSVEFTALCCPLSEKQGIFISHSRSMHHLQLARLQTSRRKRSPPRARACPSEDCFALSHLGTLIFCHGREEMFGYAAKTQRKAGGTLVAPTNPDSVCSLRKTGGANELNL